MKKYRIVQLVNGDYAIQKRVFLFWNSFYKVNTVYCGRLTEFIMTFPTKEEAMDYLTENMFKKQRDPYAVEEVILDDIHRRNYKDKENILYPPTPYAHEEIEG